MNDAREAPRGYRADESFGLGRSVGWWGMVFFIASEAVFFVYLIASYLYLRVTAEVWPPAGTPGLDLPFPVVNSVFLLGSSLPAFLAHRSLKAGNRRGLIIGLAATILLGSIFLIGQMYEYGHVGFGPDTNIYGSVFFTLTGFHGLHVLGGLGLLTTMLVLSLRGWFSPEHDLGIEASGMYWHFVDAVWIALFTALYVFQ